MLQQQQQQQRVVTVARDSGRLLCFGRVIYFFMAAHSNGQAIIFLPCGFFYVLLSIYLSFFLA